MQFFDRLRRVSTVRRSTDADYSRSTHDLSIGVDSPLSGSSSPTSPTPPKHALLRKLRRAASPSSERTGSTRIRPDDSIRRATSERTPKTPTRSTIIHINTIIAPIPGSLSASSPLNEGPSASRSSFSDLPPTNDLSERIARRPVYRRASASLPALGLSVDDYARPGPSSFALAFPSVSTSALVETEDPLQRASSAPPAPESDTATATSPMLDTFLAAGLEHSSLRTGPATHTLNTGLVHQYEQFLECAVDIEVWPASSGLQRHVSLDAMVVDGKMGSKAATRVNSVTRSAVSGSSGSSSSRSRVGRTRTRIPRIRSISVESARRHASSRRRAVSKPKVVANTARRVYARIPATHRRRAIVRRRNGSWGKTSRRTHGRPAVSEPVAVAIAAS